MWGSRLGSVVWSAILVLCCEYCVAETGSATSTDIIEQVRSALTPGFRSDEQIQRVVGLTGRGDCNSAYNTVYGTGHQSLEVQLASSQTITECLESISFAVRSSASGRETTEVYLAESGLQRLIAQQQAKTANLQGDVDYKGLKWGLGVGYSFAFDDVIEAAEVVNGIVRATDERTDRPRVVLEFHWYKWCSKKKSNVEHGCGPFVAVAATNDEILSGVGAGWMYGWRSKPGTDDSQGFSVGIGAILDDNVKSLADGFVDGSPLPSGETDVRFKSESRWSGLIFFTRTF